jgi:hypothetical protein
MKKITLKEGIDEKGTPDKKYYAFDWDDNVVHMPTKIILKNEEGDEVGMSTDDFAEYRHKIGKRPFKYKGETIVGYTEEPFKNFQTPGDKNFLIDSMRAKLGPAFDDFKEAINSGSIFSIITARGHNPNTLKQAVYNYIIDGFNGIDKDELVKNLKKYRNFSNEDDMTDDELIKVYLDMCRFYPVSYNDPEGAANPEEAKVRAMDKFVEYIKEISSDLDGKVSLTKDVSNNFIPSKPTIGFSDDDIRNVEVMKKHFKDKPDNIVKTYSTAGGIKKEY